MKIKDLKDKMPTPSSYQDFRSDNSPHYMFKEKPVYDEDGNVIDTRLPKYDPQVPPLDEDILPSSNFDLSDPNTYASVILDNDNVNAELPPSYDAFSASSAVASVVSNLPKSE